MTTSRYEKSDIHRSLFSTISQKYFKKIIYYPNTHFDCNVQSDSNHIPMQCSKHHNDWNQTRKIR